MKIADREIGSNHRPYVVAEISGNHCGVLEYALELIKAAKEAGADACKTQCYTPDSITLNVKKPDFIVQDGLWKGRQLYEVYQKAHTPPSWHKQLYEEAHRIGITIFSSVFDHSAVDLLEKLGCPAYKIASFEITDIPLIRYATQTGKPLIISTGMASDREVLEANEASEGKACFLHCTSEYPATIEAADMGRISRLEQLLGFKNPIGISDHTESVNIIPAMGVVMGVAVIEKHLKLVLEEKSEDDKFSLDPEQFADMTAAVRMAWEALKERKNNGNPSRQMRRSLYAVREIKRGDLFTSDNIRSIRPGYGLEPKMLPKVIGQKAPKDYKVGDRLT